VFVWSDWVGCIRGNVTGPVVRGGWVGCGWGCDRNVLNLSGFEGDCWFVS
jgi:hypothetical protein